MTLDEARSHVGHGVVYRPRGGHGSEGRGAMSEPAPGLWVCYCGEVALWNWSFPHWDCQGGRPLSPEEIAAREGRS